MPAGALAVVKVDLKSEVSVTGKTVMLSDLAEISGDDAPLLSGIAVAKSPDGLYDVYISSRAVKEKVRIRYLGPVVYTGATMTHVSSCTVEVSEGALDKVFMEEIIKNSPWKNIGKIEVTDVRVSRLPKVMQADANVIQAKFSSHERYLGFVTANMLIGSGPTPEKVTVTGKVKLIADVPVMKVKVASGRIITPGDLTVKSCDISTCPNANTRIEDCVGKRSKVTLLEGNPVLPSQVQRKPDICTGEIVSIEARVNNLVVRDKGIALKDGYQGETIPVKNASSGRQVVGTIIAASVVQVEL
ncbi:MAG TPA: flagellar basal body P-ring formation chaperone FlgA [Desulfomonilia bacterium]|nr:flagellar basal body P-ring formation chaperone FlgA [Desulfomonilia bacterium]